ncbi:MAG: hypothetical protein H7Z38_00450, partial [Rubrivivax sp.]|nr:hypothetical protein [Pyrinomonadaceae bacterium]
MKHAILLSEDGVPAGKLIEALRAAGVLAVPVASSNGSHDEEAARVRSELEVEPLAVLFDVVAETDLAETHAKVLRAAAAWPGVPMVACRHNAEAADGRHGAQRLDEATLKRLGFHAVAAETAQLSALLREVEESAAAEEQNAGSTLIVAPASMLLPERLSVERLRAAFEVVASLHLAADQRGAASAALAGLAALMGA